MSHKQIHKHHRVGPRLRTVSWLGTRWISASFWWSSITLLFLVCVSEWACVFIPNESLCVFQKVLCTSETRFSGCLWRKAPYSTDVNLNLLRASSHLKCDWLMRAASLVDGETETSTNIRPWESAW